MSGEGKVGMKPALAIALEVVTTRDPLVGKPRPREVKRLAQSHAARTGAQSYSSKSTCSTALSMCLEREKPQNPSDDTEARGGGVLGLGDGQPEPEQDVAAEPPAPALWPQKPRVPQGLSPVQALRAVP